MIDKFAEPRRNAAPGHDFAEVGLILGLVAALIASASLAVSDKLLAAWPPLATILQH